MANDAVAIDHETRGHGQLPERIAVVARQIDFHQRVDFLEFGGNIEDQAELARHAVFGIAQQIERDAVFLLAVAQVRLGLRGNRDECRAERIELRF